MDDEKKAELAELVAKVKDILERVWQVSGVLERHHESLLAAVVNLENELASVEADIRALAPVDPGTDGE